MLSFWFCTQYLADDTNRFQCPNRRIPQGAPASEPTKSIPEFALKGTERSHQPGSCPSQNPSRKLENNWIASKGPVLHGWLQVPNVKSLCSNNNGDAGL